MLITEHFDLDEFRCPCCLQVLEEQAIRLAKRLETVRTWYGTIRIVSGYRCTAHNRAVGGAPNSQHQVGLAADIACTNDEARFILVHLLLKNDFKRIGIAASYIHADIGTITDPVIWTYYAKT